VAALVLFGLTGVPLDPAADEFAGSIPAVRK
jgi:hypothetical protein